MKSNTIFHKFPDPTSKDKAIIDEILKDLTAGKFNDAFNKLRDGKLVASEPASYDIIKTIVNLIGKHRKDDKERSKANKLTWFLMNCFAGGYLNATRFLILSDVPFSVFDWLLNLGADPTGIVEGFSLIIILNNGYVTNNWNERFRALLAAGVDVNHRESSFGTLLHMLIANEFFERAIEFINAVNQLSPFCLNYTLVDSETKTPLLLATKVGSLPMVQAIAQQQIERNCDIGVNKSDKLGRTPLHYACILGCADIVRILISHGGDLSLRDNFGKTPADYLDEDTRILIETLKSIEINPDRDENAILNNIVVNLSTRSQLYIGSDKVPSQKQNISKCRKHLNSLTPDERRCVETQLDSFTGRAFSTRCLEGRVAVKKYLALCTPEVIKQMREKTRKEAEAQQAKLNPELFFNAAITGKTQEIRRLANIVDLNARHPLTGETALHQACRKKHYGVIEILSDCKQLHPLIKSNAGQTPLQLFMESHKGRFLGKKRPQYQTSFNKLSSSMINKLIELGDMKPGQSLCTDEDGNYKIFNSEQEAIDSVKPGSGITVESVIKGK